MSFGCRFAQLHFQFLFFFLSFVFCCIFMILSNYFLLLLGLKHLRILQLPEMSSRFVGLDHFCKRYPDERLALWPIWASYSQAKMEVYIQYFDIYTVSIYTVYTLLEMKVPWRVLQLVHMEEPNIKGYT